MRDMAVASARPVETVVLLGQDSAYISAFAAFRLVSGPSQTADATGRGDQVHPLPCRPSTTDPKSFMGRSLQVAIDVTNLVTARVSDDISSPSRVLAGVWWLDCEVSTLYGLVLESAPFSGRSAFGDLVE
jgi:hypothetical protein